MEPYVFLSKIYRKISKQTKVTFISSWIFGLVAHIYVITNPVHNYDSVTWFPQGGGAGVKSGRWMINFYSLLEKVGGGYNLPVINGLLTLLFIIGAVCLIVKIFRVQNLLHCVLLSGIIISFPPVTSTMIFMYTAPYYGAAIFLSVLAVWLTERWKLGFIGSVMCIACALGTYQAYLPITAGIFVLLIFYKCIDEELNWKKGILLGIKYLAVMIIGFIIYYLILQFLLKYWDYELSDYQGINDMGNMKISMLLEAVKETYYNCIGMIKNDYKSLSSTVLVRGCIFAMSVCSMILGGMLVFGRKRKIQDRIVLVLIGLMIPVAANSVEIMCPNSRIYTLMVYAMVVLFFVPILLTELFDKKFENQRFIKCITKWIISICMMIVIGSYTYSSNGAYMLMDYTESQTENYLTSLVDRIKSVPGYRDDMPVYIIGDYIEDQTFKNKWSETPFQYGGTATSLINVYSRRSFMINILGFNPPKASKAERKKLLENPEVLAMPIYPDDGSIKIVNDIVVVRLKDANE